MVRSPKLPDTIIYHNPDTRQDYAVRRVHRPTVNLFVAGKVLELMADSYAHQFEDPNVNHRPELVKPGTMRGRFLTRDRANIQQMYRMNSSIMNGSIYWHVDLDDKDSLDTIFYSNDRADIGGLIKVSPSRASRAQKLRVRPPNCYVNDMVVAPHWQHEADASRHHRLGSMLLHAALRHGEYSPGAKLALDGFEGNAANAWFGRLGMVAVPAAELDGWEAGPGVILPQVRLCSQVGTTLHDHVASLEQVSPWLAAAQPIVRY